MSHWAVFKKLDEYESDIHLMPVDEQGRVVGGHEPSPRCLCGPRRDRYEAHLLVHWDPERGGRYNA